MMENIIMYEEKDNLLYNFALFSREIQHHNKDMYLGNYKHSTKGFINKEEDACYNIFNLLFLFIII